MSAKAQHKNNSQKPEVKRNKTGLLDMIKTYRQVKNAGETAFYVKGYN